MVGSKRIVGKGIPVETIYSSVIRYENSSFEKPYWRIEITGHKLPELILERMLLDSEAEIWFLSKDDMENELGFDYVDYDDLERGILVWRLYDKDNKRVRAELKVYPVKFLVGFDRVENLDFLRDAFWFSVAKVVEYRR